MVGSSVRQIRPRGDTFTSALFAFRSAEYDATLQRLTGDYSVRASFLRARVLSRQGLFDRAIDELKTHKLEDLENSEGAELLALLSMAQVANRNMESVVEQLTTGRIFACSAGSVALEAEIEFATAGYFYAIGDYASASNALNRLLQPTPIGSPWRKACSTTHSLEEIRARAYDLLGHIAARDHRFSEQANLIYLGFSELDGLVGFDHFIESQMLSNLASIGVDRDVVGVYEFVRNRVAIMDFPGACIEKEFEIRRKIGSCASMHGDHLGALREFRRSSEIAPSRASKIKALLDRSALASELNEFVFAREESDFALELTRQVDWSAASSAEIIALLAMAQNLATHNSVEARRQFNFFCEYKKKLNPFQSDATDLGLTGRECQIDALISRGEGNNERSVRLNLDALDIFKRVGYVGSAATAAVEIYELTRERSYLEFAASYSKKIPQSHLARRVDRHCNASTLTA